MLILKHSLFFSSSFQPRSHFQLQFLLQNSCKVAHTHTHTCAAVVLLLLTWSVGEIRDFLKRTIARAITPSMRLRTKCSGSEGLAGNPHWEAEKCWEENLCNRVLNSGVLRSFENTVLNGSHWKHVFAAGCRGLWLCSTEAPFETCLYTEMMFLC